MKGLGKESVTFWSRNAYSGAFSGPSGEHRQTDENHYDANRRSYIGLLGSGFSRLQSAKNN